MKRSLYTIVSIWFLILIDNVEDKFDTKWMSKFNPNWKLN